MVRAAWSCLLLLVAAVPVSGQPSGSGTTVEGFDARERAEVVAGALGRTADPTARSFAGSVPVFGVEASTSGKVASARLAVQWADLTVSFGLKAAFDSDTGRAVFGDLDGLRNKSSAETGLLWTRWRIEDPASALIPACQAYAQSTGKALEAVPCSLLALEADRTAAGRAASRAVLRSIDPGTMYMVGVNARVSPEKFTFVDLPDLAARRESHTSWAVEATAAVLTKGGLLVAGRYAHEESFSGGAQSQVCSPIESTASLSCGAKVVTAPERDRRHVGGIEVRRFLGAGLAVSPRVSYDYRQRVTGVELPIYFVKSSEGGLAGGVSIGWRSDTRQITATAFAGQVLGLLVR